RIAILDFLVKYKHATKEQAKPLFGELQQGKRKAAGLYYAKVHEASDYPRDLFTQALKNVKGDLSQGQQGRFDEVMLATLHTYEAHVAASQRGRTPDLDTIIEDILDSAKQAKRRKGAP
ncbi:MAG: hypothetical protein IKH84_02270, partial [Ottowia sp.]|nr:hypothetical protein [Ottowia sp.]